MNMESSIACSFTLTLDDLHAKHPARDLACRLRWRSSRPWLSTLGVESFELSPVFEIAKTPKFPLVGSDIASKHGEKKKNTNYRMFSVKREA